MSGWAKGLLVVVLVVILGALSLGAVWIIEVPLNLLTGWFFYIRRVVPMARFNGPAVGVFVVAVPIALVLAHRMATWLWNGIGNRTSWRWKWTLSGMAALMLMFVAGMAATGVAHQTGWLINSPKPLVESSWDNRRHIAYRLKCASNLRYLGQAIELYAQTHPGYRPTTVAELINGIGELDISPELFVCAGSAQDRAPGTQPSDWRAAMLANPNLYLSYAIAPPDTPGPDKSRRVLLYDREPDNHADGISILYEGGEVVWIEKEEAREWMKSIANTPTTKN